MPPMWRSLLVCALLLVGLQSVVNAQVPSRKPKKEKVVPRFPPQYNAAEVARKKDSIAKAKLPKTTKPISSTSASKPVIDPNYKLISSTVDKDGNKVEVIEKTQNGYKVRQTIRTKVITKKFNTPFRADTIIKDSVHLVIDKKAYKLSVYYKNRELTHYRCVFGIQPIGQKMYEGDKRTPEGQFYITEVRPHSEWTYFFGINYPNETSRKIYADNLKAGKIPTGKAIGGSVGIHGVFAGGDGVITDKHNWTDGCISINTKDITELSKIIKSGTPVFIKK